MVRADFLLIELSTLRLHVIEIIEWLWCKIREATTMPKNVLSISVNMRVKWSIVHTNFGHRQLGLLQFSGILCYSSHQNKKKQLIRVRQPAKRLRVGMGGGRNMRSWQVAFLNRSSLPPFYRLIIFLFCSEHCTVRFISVFCYSSFVMLIVAVSVSETALFWFVFISLVFHPLQLQL